MVCHKIHCISIARILLEKLKQAIQRDWFGCKIFIQSPFAAHANGGIHFNIIVPIDNYTCRELFVDITPEKPTAMIRIEFQSPTFAIFVNHGGRTLPSRIVWQEYVEIFDIRLRLRHVNLTLFLRIRMFLNPYFTTRSDIFASKAFDSSVIRLYIYAISCNAHTVITIVLVKSVDVEIGIVVGLCAPEINHCPAVVSQLGFRERYSSLAEHQIGI